MKGFVYHIMDPSHLNSLDHGHIGVTNIDKGVRRRFMGHKNSSRHMRKIIIENNVDFDKHVRILCHADILYCYQLEKALRPNQKMGWNIASGGGGYNYKSSIDNLSEFRSKWQSDRMKDENLKKRQGDSFKENYYSSEESQRLRKQRSKEHMADPIKKEKCLNAIHKKKKCPHCEYENNAGNVAIHIKKHHKEILNND